VLPAAVAIVILVVAFVVVVVKGLLRSRSSDVDPLVSLDNAMPDIFRTFLFLLIIIDEEYGDE
jgi:hypothetical protein